MIKHHKYFVILFQNRKLLNELGHGELLELRLLEKSARHDFIIARHHSSSLTFRKKKFNCSTVICSTLLAGKYQLLDTIYSKENGVHVRQLG